jgi:prophage maintenance system killer protein
MESLLADALRAVRERLLSPEGDTEALRELALLLRDSSLSWTQLPEEARSNIQLALQSALPLNEGSAQVLLEELSAFQKLLGRAAAQAQSWRYPAPRDAQHAYEILTDAPADAKPSRLQVALLSAELVEPDASLSARAESLMRVVYAAQPFREYNASVAALLGLAFLQANGVAIALREAQAQRLLEAVAQQSPLQLPEADSTPDPRAWSDILEELALRYRAVFLKTERALNETQLVRLENLPEPVRATLQPAPGPSFEWRYLTLQDLIWINSEVTKSPQPYSYDRLEEATYYQYSYRQSRDVPLQAARFLWGYLKYRPFARGNLATALIATLAFLQINGYETCLPLERAAEWVEQVALRRKHPLDAIRQIAVPAIAGTHPEPLRELAHHLIEHYESALHQLGEK